MSYVSALYGWTGSPSRGRRTGNWLISRACIRRRCGPGSTGMRLTPARGRIGRRRRWSRRTAGQKRTRHGAHPSSWPTATSQKLRGKTRQGHFRELSEPAVSPLACPIIEATPGVSSGRLRGALQDDADSIVADSKSVTPKYSVAEQYGSIKVSNHRVEPHAGRSKIA